MIARVPLAFRFDFAKAKDAEGFKWKILKLTSVFTFGPVLLFCSIFYYYHFFFSIFFYSLSWSISLPWRFFFFFLISVNWERPNKQRSRTRAKWKQWHDKRDEANIKYWSFSLTFGHEPSHQTGPNYFYFFPSLSIYYTCQIFSGNNEANMYFNLWHFIKCFISYVIWEMKL